MQRLQFAVSKGTLVIDDLENSGSLHISFKPLGKPEISPAYEAWNDLETALNSGELNLRLFGYNTILEQKGFSLKGDVYLSSCHLYDPQIENGNLHFISLKPRCRIRNSTLAFMGVTQFGMVSFDECNYDALPKRVSYNHMSYFRNQPI